MAVTLLTGASFEIRGGIAFASCQSGDEAIEFALPIIAFRALMAAGQRALNEFDMDNIVIPMKAAEARQKRRR